jgi:DNA (cytosine-5)-methyltransferase 1
VTAQPRGLDLFCCWGGASRGYANAGFDMIGVDLFSYTDEEGKRRGFTQKNYPYWSWQADWRAGLERFGHLADFIHASPPCQKYSITNAARREEYPDLIEPVREALEALGKPYVIENVIGAPLLDPVELCGCMFDLRTTDRDGSEVRMWRPRRFESNIPLVQPRPGTFKLPRSKSKLPVHDGAFHDPAHQVAGSYGGARRDKVEAREVRKGGYVPSKAVQQRLLGIDWMPEVGMHQAIPPAYTEFIGRQVLDHLATSH